MTKEEHLQEGFAKMDIDANGSIAFSEYKAFKEETKERHGKHKLQKH